MFCSIRKDIKEAQSRSPLVKLFSFNNDTRNYILEVQLNVIDREQSDEGLKQTL